MTFKPEAYEPVSDWHESVFDMAKDAAKIIGIDIADINYSGFWSQGDGASFTGSYAYATGAAKRIRKEYPTATELHAIADALATVQRVNFYQLSASVSRGAGSNFYSHSGTMAVDVERCDGADADLRDACDTVRDQLRLFADWIYAALEKEYEYQRAWQLAAGWQDLAETAATEKAAARQLIRDMRKSRRVDVAPSICTALRESVRRHLDAMRDAIRERTEIARNFHYWDAGKPVSVETFAAANL